MLLINTAKQAIKKSTMEKIFAKKVESVDFMAKLQHKAESTLKEYAISMDDFTDYGKENIERDKATVEKLKTKFQVEATEKEKEAKILADILEAIILEESETSNWFGQNSSTTKVSDYDDYINHIDTIVEFTEEESANHMALGIDATFSTDIKRKFDRIKEEIEKGSLAEAKYFSSSFIKGRHIQIPRIVVGADVKTIKELGELWLEKESKAEGRKREVKKELENHPVQFQLLKQMLLQAETFEEYAQTVNQPQVADIYARLKKMIQKIYVGKNPKQNDKGDYDNMIDAIRMNLGSFK